MKNKLKMNKLTAAALALAAIGLVSTSASAQSTVSAGADDLILGMQLNGVNTDFEVDLGSFSLFTTTSTHTFDLSTSDLTSIDASWASNVGGTGVQWSVAGVTGSGNTFYATSTASSAPKLESNAATSPAQSAIGSLAAAMTEPSGFGSNGVTSGGALIGTNSNPASGITGSYTNEEGGQGATPYNFNSLVSLEQTGTGSDVLYSFVGHSGTEPAAPELGTFTLGSNGVLTYNGVAAVPEPSTYALLGLGALALLFMRRRTIKA
jgi:hypothetical protein